MSVIYDDGKRVVYDPFTTGARVLVRVGDEYTPLRAGILEHYWQEYDEDGYPATAYGEVRYDDGTTAEYVDAWDMCLDEAAYREDSAPDEAQHHERP